MIHSHCFGNGAFALTSLFIYSSGKSQPLFIKK